MKKILFIIMLGLVVGAFTNCTDQTTDLTLETNTRIVSFLNPYTSPTYAYSHTWIAGDESHTMNVAMMYAGMPLDIPVKFKFQQSNFPEDDATEEAKLSFGEYGVTFDLEESYEIPVGEKAVLVPIKFKKDPKRVNVPKATEGFYINGWATVLEIIILNEAELIERDCRIIGTTNKVHVKELPVRIP